MNTRKEIENVSDNELTSIRKVPKTNVRTVEA